MKKFFYLIFVFLTTIYACNDKSSENKSKSDSYYTCPMHPSVESNNPGSCPVCNMSLIKINRKDVDGKLPKGNFITLDSRSLQLAGVKLDTIKQSRISNSDYITGITVQDPEKTYSVNARISGRIENLYANFKGLYIEKGKLIYSLFSEKLIGQQKELIELLKYKETARKNDKLTLDMIESAKNRLITSGMSNSQIDEIIKSKKIIKYINYYAAESGYISKLNVKENMYVEEGKEIFTYNSQNTLWVEAKLFDYKNFSTEQNKIYSILPISNPNKKYNGVLIIAEPQVADGKRYSLLKIRIDNTDKKLVEGMQVKVFVSKNENNSKIVISKTAIINGKVKYIWKLAHDNTFEQVEIITGKENEKNIEILKGITQGDIIVTNGAYLVNSEFLLKK